jgi:hypothetical protein
MDNLDFKGSLESSYNTIIKMNERFRFFNT